MKLQTQINSTPSNAQFGYENKLLLLGSCFSENIGDKLSYHKFQSMSNPFGILFHPVAIENVLEAAVLDKTFTEEDVFELDGIWKSYYAHSDLNALSRLEAVINLQEAQASLRTSLVEASHIFITLGTSWTYRHLHKNMLVANCHKVPQKEFKKELLSVKEVTESLSNILTRIHSLNPEANVIFTVSPVRHLKDGFIENTLSKSHLIAAVHQLIDAEKTFYFPSYEIMMDELRDYRFYATDMLHPSEQAIDYIWEKFTAVYISASAQELSKKIVRIKQHLEHRPFNPESDSHKKFIARLEQEMNELISKHPFLDFG